ncbi:MAG: GNAT family N-acetyltransferase [Gammaproteobacteria bacterium]|jgi:ribosomal protein S18 acetylase RimI-like enzyme
MQPAIETGLSFRIEPHAADVADVQRLVAATGVFRDAEVWVAGELVAERLAHGLESGYAFLFAEADHRLAGYTCYGRIPLTRASYDLYWIAVAPQYQGRGLGRRLMAETEFLIRDAGGEQVYIETSSRARYRRTRAFYEHCGYQEVAFLADFYAPGDGKKIYCRRLA